MSSDVHCRWMIARDLKAVLEIENLCFEFPWREEDFMRALRQRNCIGAVAERNEQVVGCVLYELHKTRFHILALAVLPSMHRKGVGRHLFNYVAKRCTPERRSRILLEVRETNVDGQLFFKAMGFRAVSVLRDYYDDTTEDAYVMCYKIRAVAECEGAGK